MTGSELKHIRKSTLQLSQTELAAALGVNLSTVWRWEKGQLPISTLVAIGVEKLAADAEQSRETAA